MSIESLRFHGLFAPNSGWRKQIVPACPTPVSPSAEHEPPGRPEPDRPPRAPGRIPWAELFRRVFRIDVLQCERLVERKAQIAVVARDRERLGEVARRLGVSAILGDVTDRQVAGRDLAVSG